LNFEDLPDTDECGIIDLDGKKVGLVGLEVLSGGKYRVKLILKDPIPGVDIRGIGSGVAEFNKDGTAKEVTPPFRPQKKRLGDHPKPRGRAPLKKYGEPALWCFETGTWLGVELKKSPPKKRQKTAAAAATAAEEINFYSYRNGKTLFGINKIAEKSSI
jgi:hypothetical protein